MNKQERKKKSIEGRMSVLTMLIIFILCLFYFDYDGSNYLYNGIILLLLSSLLFVVLSNDKYYIETGFRAADKNNEAQYQLFNQMHPFLQLYDKLLILVYFVAIIVSIVMIISSFF